MVMVSTSCRIQDQSSTHAKQMLYLNDKFYNDSLFSSSRCFAEFDHDPESSSTPLVSVEDPQQRFPGTGNISNLEKINFPETTALSPGASAVTSEIALIMQRKDGSYPASQQLPIADESFGGGLSGEYGSLGLNDLSDFWGDLQLYSQEMATHAVLPPQKLGWNECSTSSTTSGDPTTTTIFVDFDRPSGQHSYSYPMPTWSAEISAREGPDLECPENIHSSEPRPVAASVVSVGLGSTLVYHGSSRSSRSKDTALPQIRSSRQLEILEKTVSPPPQPSTGRKTRFHAQSLARSQVQDAAVVKHFSDGVADSKVIPGSRVHNFLQQRPSLSMSSSPHLHARRHPGECGTGDKAPQFTSENLNPLKLEQESKEQSFARLRKHQRRRAVDGNLMTDEVNSVPTSLDHVQRERQRRDLMTSKISALEVLLPKSSKRDRVTIVYDAIELLKRLEREVKVLQQKFHETKLRRANTALSARHRQSLHQGKISIPKSIDCNMRTGGNCFSNEVVIKRLGIFMKPIATLTQPTRGTSGKSSPTQKSSMSSLVQSLGERQNLDKGNVFVEFHVHLNDTVTVQEEKLLKCRCRMDYLSTMMGVVDEFQLDVISCNIMKLSGYFICVMGLKTRTRKKTITAAQFAVRLQSAVDVDIAREAVTIGLSDAKISDSIEK